jgi:hypothetical protein
MASIGFQPHAIERVLNHVSGGLVGVYQRYEYLEERKRALHASGAYVDDLVNAKRQGDNVYLAPRAEPALEPRR